MRHRHKGFILLLLGAIFLRLLIVFLAIQLREHPDILRWKDWGRIAFLYGFADTYTPTHLSFGTYPNNMPPGTLYIASAMYWVWLQMGKVFAVFGISPGSNAWINIVLLRIFLQIPSLLADLGIGILIYRFTGLFAASLFLFNPVILFNSALWGQMDAINNFFALCAVWFYIQRKYVKGTAFYVFSLLTKFSLIYLAPLFLFSNKKIIASFVVALSVLTVFVLPISKSPIGWFWNYVVQNGTGEMTNISAFAFNLWWIIFHPTIMFGPSTDLTRVVDVWLSSSPLTQTMVGPVSLGAIATLFSVVCIIPVYYWYFKSNRSVRSFFAAFASLSILSFLVFPQMHERYLYPAFAPLIILIGFGVPVFWEFVILSLCNFINLLIVWHPMPLPVWVFDLMRDRNVQCIIAIVTTAIGCWTVLKICREINKMENKYKPIVI